MRAVTVYATVDGDTTVAGLDGRRAVSLADESTSVLVRGRDGACDSQVLE